VPSILLLSTSERRRQVAVEYISNRPLFTVLLAAIDYDVLTFIVDLSAGSGFDRYLMSPDCVSELFEIPCRYQPHELLVADAQALCSLLLT
jgi:hypothetical protein